VIHLVTVSLDGSLEVLVSGLPLGDPIHLGFDYNGRLYFSHAMIGLVRVSLSDGSTENLRFISYIRSRMTYPKAFDFDANRNAYFVNPMGNIIRVSLVTREVEIVVHGGGNSVALPTDSQGGGHIGGDSDYPINAGCVLRIESDGAWSMVADGLALIADVALADKPEECPEGIKDVPLCFSAALDACQEILNWLR
jgi:hypothetical protein